MTNRPGSSARLWFIHFVSTLLVSAGAIALVPAAAPRSDDAQTRLLSTRCGPDAPASEQAALTAGALAPDTSDSTDNDDDDDGDELPSGSMVLPGRPTVAQVLALEFVVHERETAVRSSVVDSHSLRAPPL